MTPTLSQVAHKVNEIVARDASDPFEFETRLYGCDPDGVYLLGEDSNPYELIWGTPRPNGLTAVALVATGWASRPAMRMCDRASTPSVFVCVLSPVREWTRSLL